MALKPGTRFGSYEVAESIGSGGMGEVYRATDVGLGRDVAVKILPASISADDDRIARLEREAKTLAALNHANIAHVYGLEQVNESAAIVMELVEGPTLADLIAEGPIPHDEALEIGLQITAALEVAHARGIIHRDLKPANIKLTSDGTVKVLDFGVAKILEPPLQATGPLPAQTTPAFTQAGVLLGTAAYMAPEQARGKAVDQRADIWAFGCVLFEMLTGQQAFGGEDVAVTLARVLERDADTSSLPAVISPDVRRALVLCLQKDPKRRVHHIADVRLVLEGAFSDDWPGSPVAARQRKAIMPMLAAFTAGVAVATILTLTVFAPSTKSSRVERFVVDPPAGTTLAISQQGPDVAIAPDGSRVLLTVNGSANSQLFVREIGQLDAVALTGRESRYPFFSPDGNWAAYFDRADAALKTLLVNGGPAIELASIPAAAARGAAWIDDETLIYGTGRASGLWRLSVPGGGGPEQFTKVSDAEPNHIWPSVLPRGKAVVFTIWRGSFDDSEIAIYEFATGEHRVLIEGGSFPRYSPSGHIVYAVERALRALPFDVDSLELTGNPIPVLDELITKPTGAASFDISADGSLVYMQGMQRVDELSTVVWVGRDGREEAIDLPARNYKRVAISPDATRAAFEIDDAGGVDIWMSDLLRPALSRVTNNDSLNSSPLWTPDGARIMFVSDRNGESAIYRTSPGERGEAEHIVTIDGMSQVRLYGWSPDGEMLVIGYYNPESFYDAGIVTMADRTWRPLLDPSPPGTQGSPAVSPNGEWFAYNSIETGENEVYIERFPGGGDRRTISIGSGVSAVWADDGRTLFYQSWQNMAMMEVAIDPDTMVIERPRELFNGEAYPQPPGVGRIWDFAPVGQRFLMIRPELQNENPQRIILVQNWADEFARLSEAN